MHTIELLSQQIRVSGVSFSRARMKRASSSGVASVPEAKKRKEGYAIFAK